MRRMLVTAVMGLMMTTSSALAADGETVPSLTAAATAAATSLAQKADVSAAPRVSAHYQPRPRPAMLPALYVSSALLQGYDVYSTLAVLKHGGVEVNPMMQLLTKRPAAFIGVKAGIATMGILSAERMWKRGNRIGAVAAMVGSNVFMGYVASHNAKVLGRLTK